MPQFDKITFFNQVFWLLSFFSTFYLVFLKFFLPKLSSILKARTKKLRYEINTEAMEVLKDKEDTYSSSIKSSCNSVNRATNLHLVSTNTPIELTKPACVYKLLTLAAILKSPKK